MPPRYLTPPSGPRAARDTRHSSSSNRGGIQKRRGDPLRTDKDGDLDMDATAGRGAGGDRGRGARGGRGRGQFQAQTGGSSGGRGALRSGPNNGGLNARVLQKALLRGIGAGAAIVRGPRNRMRTTAILDEAAGGGNDRGRRDGLVQISVWGWKESKAALNPDGGIKDLVAFLERKATTPNTSVNEAVRIRKSRSEGDTLIVSVRLDDVPSILRLNTFTFAGAALTIEERPVNAEQHNSTANHEATPATQDLVGKMKAMLDRRYNPELKLLDLSFLATDPEFSDTGTFSANARESKFFPALMKVCDTIFSSPQQKREAVSSVSLANNALTSVVSVTALSQTFPEIKNLDLSNNELKDLRAIESWRWKFRHLDHLVLTGNPLETAVPTYQDEILKWYPTLRLLNAIQVRSDNAISPVAKGKLPIPILTASFRDEATIGETFVKQFFPAFDTDRTALARGYYDAQSSFSLSVNTSAPRALDGRQLPVTWDSYIKRSRNLTKLSHLPAKVSRIYTGSESIRDIWLTLPSSRHPDLLSDTQKWCIECHSIPGLPDPSGQSESGVGGLIVMVHGEFEEVDVSTGQATTLRSFDRTFVLGPGQGIGGIRVVSDILVLRAYGGSSAWEPQGGEALPSPAARESTPTQPQVPQGFGTAAPGKSNEQIQKEVMALELSRETGMTLEYSGMCLEQTGWNLAQAAKAFELAKASLPSEAFT